MKNWGDAYMDEDLYTGGAAITSFIVFIGTWIWCISEYGFLLGVGLGWLPSGSVAGIAGFLWPLIALAIAAVIVFLVFN